MIVGDPAQRDIMRLRAGEIHQGGAVTRVRDNAQIDLQSGSQHDRGPRRAMRRDACHILVFREPIAHSLAILSGHEDIEIANRVAAPAIAACHDDLSFAEALTQIADERFRLDFGDIEPDPFLGHRLGERRQQLRLALFAEAAQLAQAASLGGAAKIFDRADAELVIKKLDPLRPKAGQGGDLAEVARQFVLERLEEIELARGDDGRDFAGQILANAGQFRKVLSGLQQARNALRQAFNGPRGAPIGARAEGIVALDLQKFRGLVEHCRDLGIVDRH